MLERFSFWCQRRREKKTVTRYCLELRCALSQIQGKVRNFYSTAEPNISFFIRWKQIRLEFFSLLFKSAN